MLFFAMGGIPLLLGLEGLGRALWPPQAHAEPSGLFSLSGQFRTATARVRPGPAATSAPSRPAGSRAPRPPDAPPEDARPEDAPPDGAREAAPSGRSDVVRDLERLADLHARGAIDDVEFARAKDMLLDTEEGQR